MPSFVIGRVRPNVSLSSGVMMRAAQISASSECAPLRGRHVIAGEPAGADQKAEISMVCAEWRYLTRERVGERGAIALECVFEPPVGIITAKDDGNALGAVPLGLSSGSVPWPGSLRHPRRTVAPSLRIGARQQRTARRRRMTAEGYTPIPRGEPF